MKAMAHLVAALRDPASVAGLSGPQWSALMSVARGEVLLGTLAHRVADQPLPGSVAAELRAALASANQAQIHALWEAEMCHRALSPLGITPVLLKGTAYAAAGLPNAAGRQIGDLDILVPRDRLDEAEAALISAGWEWVKDDPYDQAYYREHMHELPPLIHKTRDRMIDVHHTILPLTAKPRPDVAAMLADAVALLGDAYPPSRLREGSGVGLNGERTRLVFGSFPPLTPPAGGRGTLQILCPTDMVCHAAAHLFADGDMAGGLRNLWDIHSLLSEFSGGKDDDGFWQDLQSRAQQHQLWPAVHRAIRLSHSLFATNIPSAMAGRVRHDKYYRIRMLARDDWGRESHRLIRLIFYIRSHLIRMPLPMLLRHLWTKWRR